MSDSRTFALGATVCVVDTLSHALSARAMRCSLGQVGFADAMYLSDQDADTGGARFVPIPRLTGRDDYSRLVMKDLYGHIRTSHVLLIQWDGYVVNPEAWTDEFLNYDYIGARWGFRKDAHCVGNGGFSLRSRRLLEALQDEEITRFEPEDEMICRVYRPMLESRYGIRFAPPEVADRFSFETTYPQGRPLGFHGLFNMWRFLDDSEIPDFISAMPKSVVGSIQYLSLAKNFMDLKRIDSARAMLELRNRVFPADTKCSAMLASLNPQPNYSQGLPVGRNAACPCGSGKRYKHCCGQEASAVEAGADKLEQTSEALLRQAMTHHQAGRLGDARRGYQAVLAKTEDPVAEHFLGVLEMQEGRPVEGERRIRAALSKRNDHPDFFNNLGLCLRAQGRLEEAVAEYRKALELHPGYAPAWSNLGLDLQKLGQLDASLDAFNRALALDPELVQTRFSRALALLTLGDYSRGWAEYEWRMRCPEYAGGYKLPAIDGKPSAWQGEPLAGKSLLLIAEQGIGDTLQFIRYARALSDQGGTVDLYMPKTHVAGLLRCAEGVSEVYTGETPIPRHDFLCHVLSLPRLCGTDSLLQVPASVPYIRVPAERRQYWRSKFDTVPAKLRVGIAWAGSPTNADDRNRSFELSMLAPLFEVVEVAFVNLQLGEARKQLAALASPVLDWGDEQTEYAETAALMAELDLVLTVDTSIAHAAGAMGLPVWIMLQYQPDFRWLLNRSDSPWYPSARLFRQPSGGDWAGVVAAVREALLEQVAQIQNQEVVAS